MQYTIALAALASFLSLTTAAPTNAPRTPSAYITLEGATPSAQYSLSAPLDGTWVPTNNALSISHVVTSDGPCEFYGVDGLQLNVPSASTVDVGPPQTIVGVICGSGWQQWSRQ